MMKNILPALLLCTASAVAQPVITSNPQNTSHCPDTCASLSVTAVGNGLQYQWQKNEGSGFFNLSSTSATTSTLLVCDTVYFSFVYLCVVTDINNDTALSNTAHVNTDSCAPPIASFTYTVSGVEACFTNTSVYATSYLWNFGDGATSNLENPCHDYPDDWIYDATLYAFNDFGGDTFTMTVNLVGISEVQDDVRIYPNPATDRLVIESARILAYRIMDTQGREVKSESMASFGTFAEIALVDLEPGVYHLILTDGQGAARHTFVKQGE